MYVGACMCRTQAPVLAIVVHRKYPKSEKMDRYLRLCWLKGLTTTGNITSIYCLLHHILSNRFGKFGFRIADAYKVNRFCYRFYSFLIQILSKPKVTIRCEKSDWIFSWYWYPIRDCAQCNDHF